MKKLLNTLFVTRQGVYLAKDGEALVVKEDEETLLRVPVHHLESVLCFGRVSASPAAMGFCGENRVLLGFFTENGRFLARVQGPVAGNVLLRREQYRAADDPIRSAAVARGVIWAKVWNSRVVMQRALREHGKDGLSGGVDGLAGILERLGRCSEGMSVDSLRGVEGEAASAYFAGFDAMIVSQKEDFRFVGRSRRPPLDRVNALLSFVYTLLMSDCVAALEGVGLDPYCGFLHRDRPGRASLALDLMEELRPVLADRLVLTLINRQQVRASSFRREESGAVWLTDAGRKEVLQSWQERKREEVMHPIVEEKAALGLFPHLQALLLARHIRGDLEGYPSLLWK